MQSKYLHALVLSALCLAGACSTPRSAESKSGRNAVESGEPVDWNVSPPRNDVTGHPVRVTYRAFGSGQAFELVNESHTNPHEYYSKKIPNELAYRKIQSDQVVQALLERLDEQGAKRAAQSGAAPSYPTGSRAQAFEIETEAGVKAWLVTDRTPVAEIKQFVQAKNDFLELWNATIQMQSVEHPPEWKAASQGRPSGVPVKPLQKVP